MKQMKIILSLIFTAAYFLINAQYDYIGTEMGLNRLMGTARFVGSGGVMGSVGAEVSALSTNPAAIGMFSRSEFSITPNIQVNNTGTDYILFGNGSRFVSETEDVKLKFSLNNLAYVIANRKDQAPYIKNSNFAIALNRTADFNRKFSFYAQNNIYTYAASNADYLTSQYRLDVNSFPNSSNVNSNDFDYYGAREMGGLFTELYETNPADTSVISYASQSVLQQGQRNIWGGINELSFAWAGSFKDRVYFGVSLGIPFLNYSMATSFSEEHLGSINTSGLHPNNGRFISHRFNERVDHSGVGVNLKLGGLAKINDFLRASAFIHTPTYYGIQENYTLTYRTVFQAANNSATYERPEFEYNALTPVKMGLGLSAVSKYGFIGAEYEYSTMNTQRIFFNDMPFSEGVVNDVFKFERRGTHTLKLGGELAYEIFRLRAGFNYRTTPYVDVSPIDNLDVIVEGADLSTKTFTFGFGFRGKALSIDFAAMTTQQEEYNSFYTKQNEYNVGIKNNIQRQHYMMTLNYRF